VPSLDAGETSVLCLMHQAQEQPQEASRLLGQSSEG
jgi:hypothetical protein